MGFSITDSSDVDARASVGEGTSVWHLAQIRENARIGEDCVVGRGAYIGPGVVVGRGCKIQNYALVYEPSRLGDGVFIGPGAVLTNDTYPRAVTPSGKKKLAEDWEATGVIISEGASIGANATCVAPVTIGSWAVVAAGAVVTNNVPDFALVAGVPARQIGWVGPAGVRLEDRGDSTLRCPLTGSLFAFEGNSIRELT